MAACGPNGLGPFGWHIDDWMQPYDPITYQPSALWEKNKESQQTEAGELKSIPGQPSRFFNIHTGGGSSHTHLIPKHHISLMKVKLPGYSNCSLDVYLGSVSGRNKVITGICYASTRATGVRPPRLAKIIFNEHLIVFSTELVREWGLIRDDPIGKCRLGISEEPNQWFCYLGAMFCGSSEREGGGVRSKNWHVLKKKKKSFYVKLFVKENKQRMYCTAYLGNFKILQVR